MSIRTTYSPQTLLSITSMYDNHHPSILSSLSIRPDDPNPQAFVYDRLNTGRLRASFSNQVDYLTGSPDRRKLVPVVLGVMSKCPDAQKSVLSLYLTYLCLLLSRLYLVHSSTPFGGLVCEDVFDKVLAEVADKVDILLTYIGEIDPSAEYGVRCRHGNIECKGDIQQLCYRNRFPKLHDWWGFIQCENYAGLARVGDEELAKSCARVNGHDWDSDVKDCTTGSQGRQLLESSIEHAKQLRIRRNHKLICIRDGVWKNCDDGHEVADFVKYIEHEFDLINHPSRAEQTTV
ncbi:hypothetical protein PSHT_06201 [Puccinia striiformis]|uniref:Uncharacterized protein n=1 Tax=Puccinia striiformis TaxID=27350 RepID=A0A2S4W8P3_9BASI|nr:hypothetical protein PSHT_06201 [Puccinia striiformis]